MLSTEIVNKSILFVAKNGYCTYSNTVSNDGCKKPRRRKGKATPQAMAAINKANSVSICKDIVNCNFTTDDLHIVFSFPPEMSYIDRIKNFQNAGRRLRTLHNKKGCEFVYIYTWGRGELKENLHVHFGIKKYDTISKNDILRAVTSNGKYDNITVEFNDICEYPVYTVEQRIEALNRFAYYLCKNYDELTEEDKKEIKHRWNGSLGLQRKMPLNYIPENYADTGSLGDVTITCSDQHKRPIGGDPRKQSKALIKAYKSNKLDDKTVNRILGFRKKIFHVIEGSVRLTNDTYGNTNIYMQLVRIGSAIDVKYNPQRVKHKEYVHFYKPKFINGVDVGILSCNWVVIPI